MNYEELIKQASSPRGVEKILEDNGVTRIIGVDEVGRGPLAGPVTVSAYIRTADPGDHPWMKKVRDSKMLKPHQRYDLFKKLIEAGEWAICERDNDFIDRHGINKAVSSAMASAIDCVVQSLEDLESDLPQVVVVDGGYLPEGLKAPCPIVKLPQADAKSFNVAAASILAKCDRDTFMNDCDQKWSEYGFASHKGYGTKQHIRAIETHGPCPIHRKTFKRVAEYVA